MPSYYMLECYGPDEELRASIREVHGVEDVNWMLGRPFTDAIETPIQITLDPDDGLMMPMFDEGILLFSDEMIAALREVGVDNLDCYDTELTNGLTNQRFTNYKAVNIIGVVAAADLANSTFEAHGRPIIDVDFDGLAIDEAKARGFLLFRLAECVSGIVVHENVKKHLEGKPIAHLDFIDPQNWIG